AISRGTLLAVGKNTDVLHLAGPATEKIDLQGRLLVPGFADTHIHFYEWSLKRSDLQLENITCLEDLVALVSRSTVNRPREQWIMGQGWNETDWHTPVMPDRRILDTAAPDHAVLLWRCDLHLAAANSRALQLAGIDADTPDPPEGRIERDGNGVPTGILRELAINLMRRAMTAPTAGQIVDAFEDGARALHRLGITTIHDVRLMNDGDGAAALQTFTKLDEEKRLKLRSWVTLPGHHLDSIIALGLRTGFGNDILRIGHVKFFSDGGMGARTAWLKEPYLDAEYGMPLVDMTELAHDVARADANGLSVMIHAVGDRAAHELLNIFEQVEAQRKKQGRIPPAIPHRIEHVQMIREEDAARLENLNLALCVTPCNMILDINLIDNALGKNGQWTYAFRRLMDSGAPVMFSSDCPVCSPAPLPAIHAAVTRKRPDGTPSGGWYPDSRVSTAEALAAFTSTPAAVHASNNLGTIAPGKKADLAVLSKNILHLPPEEILQTSVDMTLFNGEIVHRLF
ncbi:MAG: amidohydrolase, partial [Desulfopila sp.]|nr:amidohydrolase [Desulfopila sp.]